MVSFQEERLRREAEHERAAQTKRKAAERLRREEAARRAEEEEHRRMEEERLRLEAERRQRLVEEERQRQQEDAARQARLDRERGAQTAASEAMMEHDFDVGEPRAPSDNHCSMSLIHVIVDVGKDVPHKRDADTQRRSRHQTNDERVA